MTCFIKLNDIGRVNRQISQITTGFANFSAQYNFQSIAIVLIMMSASVCTTDDADCRDGDQESWVEGSSAAVVFVGAIVGQMTMGYLGDLFTRNQALTLTLSISCLSALLSAVVPSGTAESQYTTIIICRFFLGIGVGGVYPLSAVKASENTLSSEQSKSKVSSIAASWAFFWQMPGLLGPWLVAYLVTLNGSISTFASWRIVLGLGALPSLIAIIGIFIEDHLTNLARIHSERETMAVLNNLKSFSGESDITVSVDEYLEDGSHNTISSLGSSSTSIPPETQRLSKNNKARSKSSSEAPITVLMILELLKNPQVRTSLLATGGTWFLFDIVAFGIGLIGGQILDAIKNSDDDNISTDSNLRYICGRQMIALSLSIPSTILGIMLLPRLGLKKLQTLSFFILAFLLLILASTLETLKRTDPEGLYALYCITIASLNFGLGITTYALPSAVFSKDIRSSFNGIAAAMGKVGAVVGSYSLLAIAKSSSYPAALGVSSAVAVLGAIATIFLVDSEQLKANAALTAESNTNTYSNLDENLGTQEDVLDSGEEIK